MGGAAAPLADLMVEIRHVSEPCAMRRPAPSKILPSELAIRLPACSSTSSERSLHVVSRTGLTKVVFISIVVKACPGSRVECTAQPMAESRRDLPATSSKARRVISCTPPGTSRSGWGWH
jgi:hypothetical protein